MGQEKMQKIIVKIDPLLGPLVPKYLERRKKDAEQLRQALNTGDLDLIKKLSHSIGGTAASYGFPELTVICRKIEGAARMHGTGAIALLLNEYEQYIHLVELT